MEKTMKRQERRRKRKEDRKKHGSADLTSYSGIKNEITPIRTEEKNRLTSKMFRRIMQVILIVTVTTLSIIYWIVGLHHYYLACNIF